MKDKLKEWVVTVSFREKTPLGFSSYGSHVGSKSEAYNLAWEWMEKDYIPCETLSDESCLYVKQEYVKAIGVKPTGICV